MHANLALNDILSKVNVLAVAVGDSTGDTLRLKESATNSGNHSIDTEGIPVSSMRLDDLEIPPNSLLWMDIEGYEGHALMGAMDLLAAGTPVVCEYNPSYLLRSGGLPKFQKALLGRRIFDLKGGSEKEITLEELVSNYPDGPDFTDILAIPAGAALK